MLLHDLAYELLAIGMMDELRLHSSQYGCDVLRRLLLMYFSGVVRCKGVLQHLAREVDHPACPSSRRQNENVASVKPGAPLLVRNSRIDKYRAHDSVPSLQTGNRKLVL